MDTTLFRREVNWWRGNGQLDKVWGTEKEISSRLAQSKTEEFQPGESKVRKIAGSPLLPKKKRGEKNGSHWTTTPCLSEPA